MNSISPSETQYVLITGVTGYIGGRLVPLLSRGRLSGAGYGARSYPVTRTLMDSAC